MTFGNVDSERLISFIERIERLTEEKKSIQADIKSVFDEAKGTGYDVKAMKVVLKLRAMDPSEREEYEFLADTYKKAVGIE